MEATAELSGAEFAQVAEHLDQSWQERPAKKTKKPAQPKPVETEEAKTLRFARSTRKTVLAKLKSIVDKGLSEVAVYNTDAEKAGRSTKTHRYCKCKVVGGEGGVGGSVCLLWGLFVGWFGLLLLCWVACWVGLLVVGSVCWFWFGWFVVWVRCVGAGLVGSVCCSAGWVGWLARFAGSAGWVGWVG